MRYPKTTTRPARHATPVSPMIRNKHHAHAASQFPKFITTPVDKQKNRRLHTTHSAQLETPHHCFFLTGLVGLVAAIPELVGAFRLPIDDLKLAKN